MIKLIIGNIFETKYMYIINPVNTLGIMGGGIAKEFKKRHPGYYLEYKKQCQNEKIKIGKVRKYHVGHYHDGEYGFIINIPTKKHWKDPSKLSYVKKGLEDFMKNYKDLGVTSVAFPMIGTGLGGLDEKNVLKLMLDTLNESIVPVEIYVTSEEILKYGNKYLKKKKIK